MPKRRVILKIELDEDEYKALEAIARSRGYELASHLIESLIRGIIKGETKLESAAGTADIEHLSRRLRRTIEDLLNPYTAKIDEINRKLSQIIEMLEAQEEREQAQERPAARAPSGERRAERYQERPAPRRKGAMERLREDGILVSSEARWINEPERFFASLERKGAKVIRLSRGEMVAVHPEFWERFTRVLSETAVRDVEEVESLLESSLGRAGVRLFRLLLREGLVFYDEDEASWRVQA